MRERIVVEKVERMSEGFLLLVRTSNGERKSLKVIASEPPKEGQSLTVVKEMGLINVLHPAINLWGKKGKR